MEKRIVICADGTWNRPEKDLKKDYPTNVLRLARAIAPFGNDSQPQQVFYDWGIGSYHDRVSGGITGAGIHKNIKDNYRYIVQNYSEGDDIYLFGFSRGAYTVRSLCGLINNVGIVKRDNANLIEQAFEHYKRRGYNYRPDGSESQKFKRAYSHQETKIKFVGVWDTVGALGIPFTFLGLFENKDEFYDSKMGPNIEIARHAMAIDEQREDFKPTTWRYREEVDLKQAWFAGVHTDIGGSYPPDKNKNLASDIALSWMIKEAGLIGLKVEDHLNNSLQPTHRSSINESRKNIYKLKEKFLRPIDFRMSEEKEKDVNKVYIHQSVQDRWNADPKYRPENLEKYINRTGWVNVVE